MLTPCQRGLVPGRQIAAADGSFCLCDGHHSRYQAVARTIRQAGLAFGIPAMHHKIRCGAGLSALERAEITIGGRNIMARFLFIIPFVLMASAASAQQQGHDACARDVSRFCRAQMNEGDQIVLACLQQNRGRLSKACAKVLTDHGQ